MVNNKQSIIGAIMALHLACVLSVFGSVTALSDDDVAIPENVQKEYDAAFARNDYQRMYEIMLPYAEAGNTDAEFMIGYLILSGSDGQHSNMSKSEQEQIGLNWIRKALDEEHFQAIAVFSRAYEWGSGELEPNQQLADCFGSATADPAKLPDCLELESKLGSWN